jgi:hypothetical protein
LAPSSRLLGTIYERVVWPDAETAITGQSGHESLGASRRSLLVLSDRLFIVGGDDRSTREAVA